MVDSIDLSAIMINCSSSCQSVNVTHLLTVMLHTEGSSIFNTTLFKDFKLEIFFHTLVSKFVIISLICLFVYFFKLQSLSVHFQAENQLTHAK